MVSKQKLEEAYRVLRNVPDVFQSFTTSDAMHFVGISDDDAESAKMALQFEHLINAQNQEHGPFIFGDKDDDKVSHFKELYHVPSLGL